MLETAKRLGIATPSQRVLNSAGALASIHPETIPYPVVLKPTRSVVERGPKRFKMGVSYAAGPAELSRRVEAYPPEAFPLLLQQRIVGPGIGVFLLIWDGEPIAMFGHRRIRENPPSGGVSAYRESFMPSEALVDHARRLLNEFRWQGVAMVEFKVDEVTGTPYLMEVNGRFWGRYNSRSMRASTFRLCLPAPRWMEGRRQWFVAGLVCKADGSGGMPTTCSLGCAMARGSSVCRPVAQASCVRSRTS